MSIIEEGQLKGKKENIIKQKGNKRQKVYNITFE